MISSGIRSRLYVVGAVAVIGLFGVAIAQQGKPVPKSDAAQPAVASVPVGPDVACGESLAALTARLRAEGFTAQAAKNNARTPELGCSATSANAAAATAQEGRCTVRRDALAASLRSQGFSAQAAKNMSWMEC
jgi:hypothetical protein